MIICAAVKFKMLNTNKEVTLCGIRHHYCYEQMADLNITHKEYEVVEEGFVDHKGNFLNREQSWKHALDCGQISWTAREKSDCKGTLFSEDLW